MNWRGGAYSAGDSWTTPGDPSEVTEALRAVVTGFCGRIIDQTSFRLQARFGSQMSLRFWGVYLARGREQLPFDLRIEVTPIGADCQVRVEAKSREGFYLAAVPKLRREYEKAYARVFDQLRAADA